MTKAGLADRVLPAAERSALAELVEAAEERGRRSRDREVEEAHARGEREGVARGHAEAVEETARLHAREMERRERALAQERATAVVEADLEGFRRGYREADERSGEVYAAEHLRLRQELDGVREAAVRVADQDGYDRGWQEASGETRAQHLEERRVMEHRLLEQSGRELAEARKVATGEGWRAATAHWQELRRDVGPLLDAMDGLIGAGSAMQRLARPTGFDISGMQQALSKARAVSGTMRRRLTAGE